MAAKASKKEAKGVGGWLSFFIFTLFISVILNVISGIEDVSSVISDPELLFSTKLWLVPLDALLFIGLIGFTIYTIFSLIKLKPNAVSLAKLLLILTFVTNLLLVIFTSVSGEQIPESGFIDSTLIFRSLFFGVIWFLYLTYSKRVKNTYPISTRKTYTVDKIMFFSIAAIPIAIYLLAFIGLSHPENKGIVNQEADIKRVLAENEYSDGRVFFKKPADLEIQKNYSGITPLYILSKGDEMSITLVSDLVDTDHKAYFDDFYNGAYEGFSQGYELDWTLINEEQTITESGFEYIKKSIRLHGENIFVLTVGAIFDDSSSRLAGFVYFAPESNSVYASYLDEVTNSIKFS